MAHGQPAWPSRWAGSALAVAAALTLAACAASVPSLVQAGPSLAPATSAPAAATTAAAGPPAPLTGLPSASAASAQQRAVALAVAGPNPQGLASADIVFQEFAAPVRYIAVFQSRQAKGVGPLTSTQPTDGQALSVLRPLFGFDGSTPVFTRALSRAKITNLGYQTDPSLYSAAGPTVTASTRSVLRAVRGSGAPPQIFNYRAGPAGSVPLTTTGLSKPAAAQVRIPGYGTEVWAYEPSTGLWRLARGGPKVAVANVVIQTVPYRQAVVSHRAGTTVPSARVLGSGQAEVLSGSIGGSGMAASGTWSKPRLDDLTNYFGRNGSPMVFQPGATWVILAPRGTRVSTSGGQ